MADDGRDQPGPVVDEAWGVAVSLVVTRREWENEGGIDGLAIPVITVRKGMDPQIPTTHKQDPQI